jgi:hypothetical protein
MNKILITGIISCILSILTLFSVGLLCYFDLSNNIELVTAEILYAIFNVLILLSLRKTLVVKYNLTHLDLIFKTLISITVLMSILSIIRQIDLRAWILIVFTTISLINLTINFVLVNRIMDPELNFIPKITYLQIYGVTFLLCFIGLFILNIVIEFKKSENLGFIKYFLNLLPIIFIGLFLYMTKKEIINNKNAYT